jgi:predicted nucleic acid-binding Zn ribbon protein
MVEKVSQHTHCQICGKAIPFTETLCSNECKEKYKTMVKKRKTLLIVMYILIFFILALFLVQNIF